MTIKEARKILGANAKGLSDEDLQRDINTATMLKDLFFDELIKERKKTI